jgi:glycosyltransferase involved in cell wall biosynthesis
VLNQQCIFPIEAHIIDDGSTDQTANIIKEYVLDHPKQLKDFSSEKNVGLVHNLSRVYAQPLHKYVALLDGDDEWTDLHKIQKQVDFLEANDNYVGCFHNMKIVSEEAIKLPDETKGQYASYNEIHAYPSDYSPEHAINRVIIPTSSLVFRSDALSEHFFETSQHHLSFSWQLLLKLVKSGNLKYMDMLSANYTNHLGGITKTTKKIEFNQGIISALKSLLSDKFYLTFKHIILDAIQKEYEYLFYLISFRELPWHQRWSINLGYYLYFTKVSLAYQQPKMIARAIQVKKNISY